ncbi:MAG: DUF1800 family protein [Acidimicrobiales bacterium]
MAALSEQAQISRLIHRFGFGPKPGQFEKLLRAGLTKTQREILSVPAVDAGLAPVVTPTFSPTGILPGGVTRALLAAENNQLLFWWLDRMVLSDNALPERMTWFWHGHWATAVSKVIYPIPMLQQNQTLRASALGDFSTMSENMITDCALLYWLDAELNSAKAPNENLARELMELFTLGIGNYTQADVQAVAQALTGYRVQLAAGQVAYYPTLHDNSIVTILGSTSSFTGPQVVGYLTSLYANQQFIADRLWFRFFDSSAPQPDSTVTDAFASRDITAAVRALIHHRALANPAHSQAKSPVEWFVSVCRALAVQPSTLALPKTVLNGLGNLGQIPFNPPNVGGWPADQFWLTAAAAEQRIALSSYLIQHGDLSPIAQLSPRDRVEGLAMWLGVPEWGKSTRDLLSQVRTDPFRLTWLAVNAPEYVVNR